VAPIGVNAEGLAMNVNADWAAAGLAIALNLKKLVFLTDTPGIYCNGSILPQVSRQDLRQLIEKSHVSGGMLTKVKAVLHALNNGVEQVHIVCGTENQAISKAFNNSPATGTVCYI
jgi:acetylglutamate kinase